MVVESVVIFLSAVVKSSAEFSSKRFLGCWWIIFCLMMLVVKVVLKFTLYESFSVESYWCFYDSLSVLLLILSVYLTVMMFTASSVLFNCMKEFKQSFKVTLLFLLLVLLFSFTSSSYLMFYFMFESSLLPILVVIVGWGYQPERLQAGVYLMVYTLFMSLPLFLSLIYLESTFLMGGMTGFYMESDGLVVDGFKSKYTMIFLIFAFMVKLPVFLVHLWLPKAHVEAPVAGSMVLAGVLLSLGGYGLYRVFMSFSASFIVSFSELLVSVGVVGTVVVGVVCCRLNDMKSLVAYSSVGHMGLVMCGLMTNSGWGYTGVVVLMLSHGLSSSGLFCFVNLIYERSNSRSMFMNKGLPSYIPLFSFFLFMLCISNFSAPPTLGFISEVLLLISMVYYDWLVMLPLLVGSFLGVVFTFYLFMVGYHGKMFKMEGTGSGVFLDYHQLVLHLIPIYFLIISGDLLVN